MQKQETRETLWYKTGAIFFIGYGLVYLLVFIKRLFFSSITIDNIASLYMHDLESSFIFSIIGGTIVFMFVYNKLQLRQKDRNLFEQLPNLFMLRMILYTCIYFMIILTLLGVHLIFTTIVIHQTGGSINLSYSLFYWAVVILSIDRVCHFINMDSKRLRMLLILPFLLFYLTVLIMYQFDPAYQLVFQFIGNGLIILMLGLYLVEKYLITRNEERR
ncbi:hypothetical protein [Alkalihalobacillus sp. AL-G]|uniref:hypothetical protein n=1 Tax=Alkalihalobacillus sp. AL-G TaxID=2926399 RepID=UPI00272CC992|nr:hypothetical protein [Alkalihalobacillus sp. AL-G]WLD94092.1 hypothetical protein MOJ78_04115 [Alkalihalobacillus sp. AL-G]